MLEVMSHGASLGVVWITELSSLICNFIADGCYSQGWVLNAVSFAPYIVLVTPVSFLLSLCYRKNLL